MKYLKSFDNKIKSYMDFINESVKFKLNDEFDNIISSIDNKKNARIIESMLVKSILTTFIDSIKRDYRKDENGNELLPKDFSTLSTQNKLNIIFNSQSITRILYRKYREKLVSIIDYVGTNNINADNFEELYQKSVQWHEEIAKGAATDKKDTIVKRKDETEDTDKFIEYPNGWYWINLNTYYSSDEAQNMGHCGRDSGKILLSLRDNNSNSHVTVSYNKSEESLNQCKGRGNTKPDEEYHKYILDLLYNEKYPINMIMTGSYKPHLDFNLMDLTEEERDELINKKPSLEYTDNMFEVYFEDEQWQKIVSMVENGFNYEGDKKFSDLDFFKFVVNQKLNKNDYIEVDWYKPLLGLHNSKEDIEFYLTNYNDNALKSKKANDVYIFWKHGLISNGDAETSIKDLKIKDDKWFIKWKFESWSEFSFMFSEDNMDGSNSYTYKEYLENNIDDMERTDYSFSFNDCDLSDLTIKTKTAILEKIVEEGIVLEEYEIEELMESGEDYGFETIEDYSFDKVKETILADMSGDSLKVFLKLDSLEDIKYNIIHGYEDAQNGADESKMFDAIIKPIKEFFNTREVVWDDNNFLLLEFDPELAMLLNKCTDNGYSYTLKEIIEEIFDSSTRENAHEFGVNEDDFPEFLKFKYPYNGWCGSIDVNSLNEIVLDRVRY